MTNATFTTSEAPTLTLKIRRRAETPIVRADENSENVIWFTISTERQASDGGILIADGMDAKEFLGRPIVFFQHNYTDIVGKCVNLKRSKEGWDAAVELATQSEMSPEAWRCVSWMRRNKIGAASIGFVCTEVDWEPEAAELAKYGATGRGWIGRQWTLREWSIVTLPADPGAGMHSDPFMAIKDGDERRAVKAAFARAQATRYVEGETMTTNDSATTSGSAVTQATFTTGAREADPAVIESLTTIQTMLSAQADKIDTLTALVQSMAEGEPADEAEEETTADPEASAGMEGEKAEKEVEARLDKILAVLK